MRILVVNAGSSSLKLRSQRALLGLAVADAAADEQVRVVARRPVRMNERVAQLAAFVGRARGVGRHVARRASRARRARDNPRARKDP
jgi:hypothetical protein